MHEGLRKAAELGQGIRMASISRDDLLERGTLHNRIGDGVVGAASNPTIFQKAISESDLYDEQLARKDIQDARDILAPVHVRGAKKDGYVSPDFAYDTPKTVEEALRLRELVDRPNLPVKIPATKPGLTAVEEFTAQGKSGNVTLVLSVARYGAAAKVGIRGLQRLVEAGGERRELLRLARRHQGGQAARRGRSAGPEREAGVRGVRGDLLRQGVGVPRVQGRHKAACVLGPRPRRRTPTPRGHSPRGRTQWSLDHAKRLPRELAEAGVNYDHVTPTLEKEGVAKSGGSFDEVLGVMSERGASRCINQP